MKSIIKYFEFREYLLEKMFKNLNFKRIYIALSCTKKAFNFLRRATQITDLKSAFLNAKNKFFQEGNSRTDSE